MDRSSKLSLRVLVVDDHLDTADALAWVLHDLGHEARVAYDGPSALRTFERLSPDVILQDLLLPGMDGFAIAREIRERSAPRRAFIVAVTGAAKMARHARESAVFDDLIVKPAGLEALLGVLGKAASRIL